MYKYIGKPYTLNEFVSGCEIYSKINDYFNFIKQFELTDIVKEKPSLFFVEEEDFELFFNKFTDLISIILIEPTNVEIIVLKIKNISLRYMGAFFIIQHILKVANEIRNNTIIKIFPEPNEFDYLKIQLEIENLRNECESLFYEVFEIDAKVNELMILAVEKTILIPNKTMQITLYFEAFLLKLKDYYFKPFERYQSFDFQLPKKERIQGVEYNALYKVLIFEKIYTSTKYGDLSDIKKSELLSLIFNESKNTINNHLRIMAGDSSKRTKSFDKALVDIENILKKFDL